MKVKHKMSFEAYADEAVDLMLNTAVGKPFRDSDGNIIGKIVEVSRTENPKVLEFISELEVGGYVIDNQSQTLASFDARRKD